MPDAIEMNTSPPRRTRRTPDQMIADLRMQIAAVKARVEQERTNPPLAATPRRIRPIVATKPADSPVATTGAAGSLDARIEARVHAFTVDLVALIKRATLEAIQSALDGLGDRGMPETGREVVPEPRKNPLASGITEASSALVLNASGLPAVSFDLYERLALERALDESSGNQLAAARLLGVGKSTLYRKVKRLGVEVGVGREFSDTQLHAMGVPLAKPVSLDRHERAAIQRALADSGGGTLAAARLMRAGKSTFYRRMTALGVATPAVRQRARRSRNDRSQELLDYVIEHPGERGRDIYAGLRGSPSPSLTV